MRVFGAPLPDWAVWQGRSMLVLLAAGWLVATLRKQRRRAQAEPSAGLALPVVPLSAVSSTASGTPSSSSPSALDVLHAPAVPPLVGSPGREPASPPAAAPRPTGGDPPVPIPGRRAPGRRAAERRADDRGHGDRRMHRFEVTLQPGGHILDAAPGSSLLDVCRAAGLPIEPGCRMGLCGNDPIYVLEGSGNLSPAGPDEQATLERLGLPEGARMACAARVLGNIVVSLEAGLEPAARSTDPVADIPKRLVARNGARAGAPQAAARSRGADPSIRRVVVLGNGIAGVTAADHVRRHHPDCEIDLVAAEPHAFYNRTSVSRLVYTREAMERMYLLPPSWYADRRITTSLNTRAARIDRRGGHVVLGTGEQLAYDRLVLATGSRPRVLPIEGFGIEGSFTLRGADDAMRLRVYAQHREARRAVIVGGGVLGLEAADAARKLGLEATIVELADRLSPVQLDRPAAELLLGDVERRGIEVLLGRSVASVASDGERVTGVTLDDGSRRAAELVVVCAGITPNAELARNAGLEVNRGVLVDDTLRTSDPAIYAAGDVAEHSGRLYGHWPAAVEQAEAAAVNAIGGRRHYAGSLVATHLKVTGVELTSIGRPHVEPGDVEIALCDEGSGRYRKLVIADGRIVGAILLGHPSDASAVFAAARRNRDVTSYLEALSDGDWDVLIEPSLEQAAQTGTGRPTVVANGGAPRPGGTNGGAPANGSAPAKHGPSNVRAPANGSAPANGRTRANGAMPARGRTPVGGRETSVPGR